MEGRLEQDGAVLQQGVVDASADTGQAVKVVEVKMGGHGRDDTDIPVSLSLPPCAFFARCA